MLTYEVKTKLPCLLPESDVRDESVRDQDRKNKMEGKRYADKRRGAEDNATRQSAAKEPGPGKITAKI